MPIQRTDAPAATDYVNSNFEKEDENEIASHSASLQGGWDVAEQTKAAAPSQSKFSDYFKVRDDLALVAFIKGAPVDSFLQHWIRRTGKMSFRCLGAGCPLCATGDVPSPRFVFFVLEFEMTAGQVEPVSKVWTVGAKVMELLKDINSDPRKGGPLEGRFFTVHKVGDKQRAQTSVVGVKARDLEEDWKIPTAAAEEAVAEAQANAEPKLYFDSLEDLAEVASELRRSA